MSFLFYQYSQAIAEFQEGFGNLLRLKGSKVDPAGCEPATQRIRVQLLFGLCFTFIHCAIVYWLIKSNNHLSDGVGKPNGLTVSAGKKFSKFQILVHHSTTYIMSSSLHLSFPMLSEG